MDFVGIVVSGKLGPGERAVGGAEIDPDGILGQLLLHFNFRRREYGEILT